MTRERNDAYAQGAIDCRSNNLDRAFAFEGHDQESYKLGWQRAFACACQRLDVAELLPHHFGGA